MRAYELKTWVHTPSFGNYFAANICQYDMTVQMSMLWQTSMTAVRAHLKQSSVQTAVKNWRISLLVFFFPEAAEEKILFTNFWLEILL